MDRKYEMSYILVDDDEDDRHFLRMALQEALRPLPIYEFSNGQELLDYLTYAGIREDRDNHWLLVIDINMPIMDGLTTVTHIRAREDWQHIPILMLSTSDSDSIIDEALAAGANGYLVKPTSLKEYIRLFDKFFAPWLQKNPS